MNKINNSNTAKVLASTLFLTLAVTGCESMPSSIGSSNQTPVVNNQAAVAVSTGQHKAVYTASELNQDSLYRANDITKTRIAGVPTPAVSISNVDYIPTVIIPKTTSNQSDVLEVSLLDDFISHISPNARHYPPNFDSKSDRYHAKEKLKELESWIRPYADQPNASYEVLLRAAKLNGMGRNLDLGSDYAVRASNYIAKAIERQPNSAEANFIYGMMLSEGGGFREGKKYLLKAASLSYKEAEQSLAQADLLSDNRSAALSRLRTLQHKYPNDETIAKQIAIVEAGKYYIWDLDAE